MKLGVQVCVVINSYRRYFVLYMYINIVVYDNSFLFFTGQKECAMFLIAILSYM